MEIQALRNKIFQDNCALEWFGQFNQPIINDLTDDEVKELLEELDIEVVQGMLSKDCVGVYDRRNNIDYEEIIKLYDNDIVFEFKCSNRALMVR